MGHIKRADEMGISICTQILGKTDTRRQNDRRLKAGIIISVAFTTWKQMTGRIGEP